MITTNCVTNHAVAAAGRTATQRSQKRTGAHLSGWEINGSGCGSIRIGSSIVEATALGTINFCPQLGHGISLPNKSCSAESFCPQWGHLNLIALFSSEYLVALF